ncbi:unnamed protein product, partial [Ilex paraguariensis]
ESDLFSRTTMIRTTGGATQLSGKTQPMVDLSYPAVGNNYQLGGVFTGKDEKVGGVSLPMAMPQMNGATGVVWPPNSSLSAVTTTIGVVVIISPGTLSFICPPG